MSGYQVLSDLISLNAKATTTLIEDLARLGATGLRIKAERDELAEALRELSDAMDEYSRTTQDATFTWAHVEARWRSARDMARAALSKCGVAS